MQTEAGRISDTFLTTYGLNCTVTQKVKVCYMRAEGHGEADGHISVTFLYEPQQ